ncbi:MAG: sigma 54-interacting transcriptional regulator [Nitrospinota bacterium]
MVQLKNSDHLNKTKTANFIIDHGIFLKFLIDFTVKLLDAKNASILLHDSTSKKLIFMITSGEQTNALKSIELNMDEGIAGWVFTHGIPLLVPSVKEDKRWSSRVAELLDIDTKSIACAPLRQKDKIIGVLEIMDRNDNSPLVEKDLVQLQVLAELISDSLVKQLQLKEATTKIQELTEAASAKNIIIGQSPSILRAIEDAIKVASSNATVLITGESGVGKELFAHLIHDRSKRSSGPLVKINCGAVPETLLERELFGNEKGAFTGADKLSLGLFEAADRGTIFLDEVGETTAAMQVKLLRVLQDGTFTRIGGANSIKVDTRVVAATNRDIKEMVSTKRFREDLYYRLNVVNIHLPPLRDRTEDIPLLAEHCLDRLRQELGRAKLSFSKEALQMISSYPWPGNVRQLDNAIEHAAILSEDEVIDLSDLPSDLQLDNTIKKVSEPTFKEAQNQFKKLFIQERLEKFNYNRTKAAKSLDIQRTYLSKIINTLNIEKQ